MPTAYVTAPRDDADRIARDLVENRLAACVNRVPCHSTYRWEGEVIDDEEEILLAKTTADAYPDLIDRIEEVHPYDVPCVERFDEAAVLDRFGDWIGEEVRDG